MLLKSGSIGAILRISDYPPIIVSVIVDPSGAFFSVYLVFGADEKSPPKKPELC